MKKFLPILSLIFSVYGNAASLDITGWNQEGLGGSNKNVKISGVASGEVPFFTGTAGTIDSRKIISTDINDTTATGRSLMTTTDASTARTTLGLVIGTDVQPYDLDLAAIAALTTTSFGRGLLDDADASAGRDSLAVGTTKAGTQASPITTNPYSPTWSQEQNVIYYGASGQINLPVASSYTNRTLIVYSTGTYTIVVDPNGSDYIVESGASLGAGVSDSISATAGSAVAYTSDGVGWNKFEGGGAGVAALTPWTENIDGGGFSLTGAGAISATSFTGSASGLTGIPAAQLSGTIPDITVENLTTSRNNIITPVAGASNIIVTDNGQTNITLDATTETLTYSATPTTGAWFRYALTAHSSDCTVTIPSTYSYAVGGSRTTYTVRANKNAYIVCHRTASGYEMWGEPVEIGDLANDSTPATTSKIEIDQGSGGEYATLAQLWTNAAIAAGTATTASAGDNDTSVATTAFVQTEVDGTATGSWAAPYTTASSLSPTWSGPIYAVYMGVAQTVILPDAAAYAQRGIVVYSTGSFVLTVDPDSDDFIVRDGTAQADGVTITVTAAAGNYVCLISDGTNWITLGYKGTLAQGS